MDKRSWPWKKKSSDKPATEKANVLASDSSATASDINSTQRDKGKLDNNDKKSKYVQISMESYMQLTGLEDQMRSYKVQAQGLEDEVKELNEKLAETHLEMINKENLVKQHAKVAEEAVSGWEKAETEAATLKNHLESVTLLKLTAEDRASHLDGALKECMRQIRNLKEDHEQKLQEVILSKTKIFDKMKFDLETQIANLDQQLLRAAAENAAISRSLQERSNMLMKISEEKSQAEAQIELLKSNIESCEKEVNSLKYECHVARKEVEIRNEEKNMSLRSAEAANKQHLEGVKKIAKLEVECQRLRSLVRKKLPGPAALAQMKLEVENMGREYGESHVRRPTTRSPTAQISQVPGFALDNLTKCQKENKLLRERLIAMEGEASMLKEALSNRNTELQTCRSLYAQASSKLQSLESQLKANGESRSPTIDVLVPSESVSSQKAGKLPSFTSMSECGNDDNVSCAGSYGTRSFSDPSDIQKDKNAYHESDNNKNLYLMDDFLEMEKIAYQSHGSHETVSSPSVCSGVTEPDLVHQVGSFEVHTSSPSKDLSASEYQVTLREDSAVAIPQLQADSFFFTKLKSEISRVIESMSSEKDMEKIKVDVRRIMQDMLDTSRRQSENDVEAAHGFGSVSDVDVAQITSMKGATLSGDILFIDNAQINQELERAISDIYSFVMILGKEAKVVPGASPDGYGVTECLNKFSAKYTEAALKGINLVDFVLDMSYVLREASKLHFNVLGFKSSEVESRSSDCIDKIALPMNKGAVDSSREVSQNRCSRLSDSASDPDTPSAGNLVPTSESTAATCKCSSEEFEDLKMDKDNLAVELARYTEKYESTKIQLLEAEQLVSDVKSQLTSAQKFNSLAETQLKCMAESYRLLETRAEELQTQVNLLQGKVEHLDLELQEERRCHQDALNRCNDLLEQLHRIETREVADNDGKYSQEKELSAAAEKLAECQETIFLLGKQLKALHPHSDSINFPSKNRSQKIEASIEEESPITGMIFTDQHSYRMDATGSFYLNRAGSESPSDIFDAQFSPSDSEANNPLSSALRSNHQKHHPAKSSSSSASSTPTPEKQTRGFSRFFSSKGKSAN